jgi:hypothetical protein
VAVDLSGARTELVTLSHPSEPGLSSLGAARERSKRGSIEFFAVISGCYWAGLRGTPDAPAGTLSGLAGAGPGVVGHRPPGALSVDLQLAPDCVIEILSLDSPPSVSQTATAAPTPNSRNAHAARLGGGWLTAVDGCSQPTMRPGSCPVDPVRGTILPRLAG